MIKEKMENARIERATFRMQSGRSPTELIPRYTIARKYYPINCVRLHSP